MNLRSRSLFIISHCLILFTFVVMLGCNSSSTPTSPTLNNTAMISNVLNAFSYSVAANNFTASDTFDLTFSADSLAYSLASGNYVSGSALVSVLDSNGAVIIRDSVFTNKLVGATLSGKGIPRRFAIACNHYTGSMNFSMAGNKAQNQQVSP